MPAGKINTHVVASGSIWLSQFEVANVIIVSSLQDFVERHFVFL